MQSMNPNNTRPLQAKMARIFQEENIDFIFLDFIKIVLQIGYKNASKYNKIEMSVEKVLTGFLKTRVRIEYLSL